MSEGSEQVIAEYFLDFIWPCCPSCDGFRCDFPNTSSRERRRIHAELQIVKDSHGSIYLRAVGRDAEEVRNVLGL